LAIEEAIFFTGWVRNEAGENVELLEKEKALRHESMSEITSSLQELADMLEYNAPFTGQRVLDLAIQKTAIAVDLQKKLKTRRVGSTPVPVVIPHFLYPIPRSHVYPCSPTSSHLQESLNKPTISLNMDLFLIVSIFFCI
jgi:hypothetical protein